MTKAIKLDKNNIVKFITEYDDSSPIPEGWVTVPNDLEIEVFDKYEDGTVIPKAEHEGYITEVTKQQFNILFLPFIHKINQAMNPDTDGLSNGGKQEALAIAATTAHLLKILEANPENTLINIKSPIVQSMFQQLVTMNILTQEEVDTASKGLKL